MNPILSAARTLRVMVDVCGVRGIPVLTGQLRRRLLSGFSDEAQGVVRGARVLEIGGPSRVFRPEGSLPVYGLPASIDNVNYAGATLWEADLSDGGPYAPQGERVGTQWLREATDLAGLGDGYDAVISSHTLEHTANPLRALREWRRLTRPGGHLLIVLPHRDGTFDHRRPVTSMAHLREDETGDRTEDDRTHVPEVLALHDLARDPGLDDLDQQRERLENNLSTRAMHHHVFTTASVLEVLRETGWSPLAAEAVWPHDIQVLARNGGPDVDVPVTSPFPSDRTR